MHMIVVMLLPFLGTALGALFVFLPGKFQTPSAERILNGFAAGVMVAASVWSLIIPSLEYMEHWSKWRFLPAVAGIWSGFLFLAVIDIFLPHSQIPSQQDMTVHRSHKITMLILAVTLHNLPEGMAVGAAAAGYGIGDGAVSYASLLSLSIGISLQNIPEGAIISLPLHSSGLTRMRAFLTGILSGIVEPLGAILILLLTWMIASVLPFLLGFAAGAMLYVVAETLIPEINSERQAQSGILAFCAGFTVMLALDVALG